MIDETRNERKKIILKCLDIFSEIYSLKFSPYISNRICEQIVARYFGNDKDDKGIVGKMRDYMNNPESRLDIHKIIAGTQYSIITQLLLYKDGEKFFNPMDIRERRRNVDRE